MSNNKKNVKMFEVKFYRYENGHIQTDRLERIEKMNKSDLFKIADLRHPVLNKNEYFQVQSTDMENNLKQTFSLLSSFHYLIVNRK